jgi:uncharacterized Zn-finger protein
LFRHQPIAYLGTQVGQCRRIHRPPRRAIWWSLLVADGPPPAPWRKLSKFISSPIHRAPNAFFRGTSGSPQLSPVPSPADPSPPLPSGAQLFLHHLDICCFDPSQTSEQQNPQVMASFGNANTMAARSPPDHLNTEYEAATPEPNPFSCNICKKTYSRVDHLARHYRSHTHERPFLCETCGKAFARA